MPANTHEEICSLFPKYMAEGDIEVASRQPDDTWRWLIGDPFTVGRHSAS